MYRNITVVSKGDLYLPEDSISVYTVARCELCLIRDDYTVFNNCAITNEELPISINQLCIS